MSEETIQQDRSPRSPTIALEEAIEITRKLYQAARTATIKPDVAVKALGYSGINGTAMTTLATLAQYGLVDRTGGNVGVTPLAVKIFHPTSTEQKEQAIQEASQTPAVFRELLRGFEECSADIITGQLIQNRFTPDRARKVAQVFIANLAYIGPSSTKEAKEGSNEDIQNSETAGKVLPVAPGGANNPSGSAGAADEKTKPAPPANNVLATFKMPLGSCVVEVTFTGESLEPKAFKRLAQYAEIWKETYEEELEAQKLKERESLKDIL